MGYFKLWLQREAWKRNSESIEDVHEADRICEIRKFLIAELGSGSFIVIIRFGHAASATRSRSMSPASRHTGTSTRLSIAMPDARKKHLRLGWSPERNRWGSRAARVERSAPALGGSAVRFVTL